MTRRKQSVTIRDVAQAAKVSPGTVSRAMRGSELVNEETRKHILQVAQTLNYTPNLSAQRLSIGRTLSIKVIIPFFTRPAAAARLNGVVNVLAESNYDLIIHNVSTPEQRRTCLETIPTPSQVDALLIISICPTDEEAHRLAEAELPVTLVDAYHEKLTMHHCVRGMDVWGGRQATEYLIQLGHRKIGFIGDRVDTPFNFISSRDRHLGYQQALETAGIKPDAAYYRENDHGRKEARASAKELLTLPNRPTAIFAASDTQAIGVLEAARELELRVPEDVSVIGYDDIEVADIVGLTTMRQQLFKSGEIGIQLLLEKLDHEEVNPVCEVLPPQLTPRHTTAPPQPSNPRCSAVPPDAPNTS